MPQMTKRHADDLFERYADLPPAEFAKVTTRIWSLMESHLDEPMLAKGARQFFHIARRAMNELNDETPEA